LHAGVPPNWDKNTLLSQSFMVEKHLKKSAVGSFINQMYGDSPHTCKVDQCPKKISVSANSLFSCKNHALKSVGAVFCPILCSNSKVPSARQKRNMIRFKDKQIFSVAC
jgi:hypothetical protein